MRPLRRPFDVNYPGNACPATRFDPWQCLWHAISYDAPRTATIDMGRMGRGSLNG